METNKGFESRLAGLQEHMLHFALTLIPDRDQALDLVQETSLRALDNREKYYSNINFKGWVFTIMRNLFINRCRRQALYPSMPEGLDGQSLPEHTVSGAPTPEGAYTAKSINRAIVGFPDSYRIPFTMHLDGYRYEEIASRLGLPIGTVKSRIYFARKRLQALFRDYRHIC